MTYITGPDGLPMARVKRDEKTGDMIVETVHATTPPAAAPPDDGYDRLRFLVSYWRDHGTLCADPDEVEALDRLLREHAADKARLDWLATSDYIDCITSADAEIWGDDIRFQVLPWTGKESGHKTLREAIDAAISAPATSKP